MFIARVPKGRTVKEFVIGVLVLPTMLSFFWMSVFGGSAVFFEQSGVGISRAVNDNVATALFEMFENIPLTGIISFIGILLVVTFFVTSSDSGSLVVDHLTSGGKVAAKIDALVYDAPVLAHYAANEGRGEVALAGPEFQTQRYGIAVSADQELREDLNRSLLRVIESGDCDDLYEEWFGN